MNFQTMEIVKSKLQVTHHRAHNNEKWPQKHSRDSKLCHTQLALKAKSSGGSGRHFGRALSCEAGEFQEEAVMSAMPPFMLVAHKDWHNENAFRFQGKSEILRFRTG